MFHKTYETNLSEYVSIYHQYDRSKYMQKEKPISTIPNIPHEKCEKSTGRNEIENGMEKDKWVSPSDALLGHTKLIPPFTSKIHRALAHEGLLGIGDEVLQMKYDAFLQKLNNLIKDNDSVWTYILSNQNKIIEVKVNKIFGELGKKKCQTLIEESSSFFQTTLQEMEQCLLKNIKDIIAHAHASIVNDLNITIKEKLKKEKNVLDKKLYKKFIIELKKLEDYYRLLLRNEICRKTKFINQCLVSRDETYDIYIKQFEAENILGCMYVMSNERKKCYIRKLNIEKLYSKEALEKIQELKERKQILSDFQSKSSLSTINKDWEYKIRKIIQLFVKFISFSLKLLPEQTSFLLELQNILILRMNDILQNPLYPKPTLINLTKKNSEQFDIKFLKTRQYEPGNIPCPEPFTIEGALHPPTPREGDSTETLLLDEELPYFRVDRKYFYARCDKLEEVKKMLQKQSMVCICSECISPTPVTQTASHDISTISEDNKVITPPQKNVFDEGNYSGIESSLEDLPVPEYKRFEECPLNCYKKYVHELEFPQLNEYIDFTEEKYRIVKGMLSDLKIQSKPNLLDVKKRMDQYSTEFPFDTTKVISYDEGTQYYSQESLLLDNSVENICPYEKKTCKGESNMDKQAIPSEEEIKTLRKQSLLNLLHERPSIINLFSDEWYNILQQK